MIDVLGASFLAIGFAVIVQVLGLVRHASSAMTLSNDAMKVLSNASLSDEEKERAMQTKAVKLFRLFFVLTFGGIVALLAPVAVVWGLDRLGLVSLDGVMHAALSWPFIVGVTVIAVALFWFMGRPRHGVRE